MPREIPDFPKDFKKPTVDEGGCYDIELITPMVGGGATAGVVDPDFPIRPTAIRGQLRHWWRLTRGLSLGAGMWLREEEIFGSTEFPSPVTISVKPLAKTADLYPIRDIRPTSTRGYVLFPSIDKQQDILKHGYQFRLNVTTCTAGQLQKRRAAQNRNRKPTEQLPPAIEPIQDQLDDALKAWLLFGGIGARTRRGCGSLRLLKEPMPVLKDILKRMPQGFRVFQAGSQTDHLKAWEQLIEILKKFRQQMPAGRGTPRKKFPEAESLRRISGKRKRGTQSIPEQDMPTGFPRAELGLPIVFQFKDGSGPDGVTALPHGLDASGMALQRMSSPVILKPIPVSPTHSVPAIIEVHRPMGLTVDVAGQSKLLVSDPEFAQYPNSPLAESKSGSAIEAFIKFTGFTEVQR
jgi:CRISPR-associated protein Cmr1